ncbi:MAG: hypothetical protein IH831_08495 [Planctomycetes bacterium]|nr:hypothetical protein [Planctomycetota bacterium]
MSKRKKRTSGQFWAKPRSVVASDDRPVLNTPPAGKSRRRVRWFIGVFLLVNLLAPLKWYLGQAVGADVDERFAWRMFSSNSLQRCQVKLWETIVVDGQTVERSVSLETIVQPAWAKFLLRYHQPALVRHLLREHCRQTEARSVGFQRTGTWSDGSPVAPYVLTIDQDQE